MTAGIPAADLREHERQKQGSKNNDSGSDDDEPATKRSKPEGLLGSAPGLLQGGPGMVTGMMPPPGMQMGHMMPMGPMGSHFMHHAGMPLMTAHMQAVMQGQGAPQKPLFPSAIPSSPGGPVAPVVGADFKPITSATISAPPTTNTPGSNSSSSSDGNKIVTIATSSATSKIIHPTEDTSLEEMRAKIIKYTKILPPKSDDGVSNSSTAASEGEQMLYKLTIKTSLRL
ncbi:hypothetical protein JTB14_001028 [Gonioctena quinquepunctata]|nr:hypothetical protein JTB14_001028 [Gonioctena quinquepunctata]